MSERVKRQRISVLIIACNIAVLAVVYSLVSHRQAPAVVTGFQTAHAPDIGDLAPDFTLPTLGGGVRSLSSLRGSPEALGFFCGCDRCHAAARQIALLQRHGTMKRFTAVIALDRTDAKRFLETTGLTATVFLDPSDATAIEYDSDDCPRLWGLSGDEHVIMKSSSALQGTELTNTLDQFRESVRPSLPGKSRLRY